MERINDQNKNQITNSHKTLKIEKVYCTNIYTLLLAVQSRDHLLAMSLKLLPPEVCERCEIFVRYRRKKVTDKIGTMILIGATSLVALKLHSLNNFDPKAST